MKDLVYHKEYRSKYLLIFCNWRPLTVPVGFAVIMGRGFVELSISAYFALTIIFKFWETEEWESDECT
jgi:hypothetical protein